jgi:DNA-binding NarL/FixJ family response regulator
VITDVRMPSGHTDDGLRPAREIRERFPGTAIVVLSRYVMECAAVDLVGGDAAGVGYLLKDRIADIDAFIDALNRVADGGSALDADVGSRMIGRGDTDALDRLTPREREVLGFMAAGRANRGSRRRSSCPRTRSRSTSTTCCASSTSPARPPTIAA